MEEEKINQPEQINQQEEENKVVLFCIQIFFNGI